jgi:hypothetical protein
MESLVALAAIVLSHCSASTCHLAYWRGVLVIPYSMVGCVLGNQLSCRPLNIRRDRPRNIWHYFDMFRESFNASSLIKSKFAHVTSQNTISWIIYLISSSSFFGNQAILHYSGHVTHKSHTKNKSFSQPSLSFPSRAEKEEPSASPVRISECVRNLPN